MYQSHLAKILIWACALLAPLPGAWADAPLHFIDDQVAAHPGQSGSYVLDTGDEALIARAWLTDHAGRTLEVQYFIWSSDNVGILAAEALLRAADRGVKVRVIVDDLLMDAPDESLLALAHHPNIDIRIYNPKSSVGTPVQKKAVNVEPTLAASTSACTTRCWSSTAKSRSPAAATWPTNISTTTTSTTSATATCCWSAPW